MAEEIAMYVEVLMILGIFAIVALLMEMQVQDIQKKIKYLIGKGPVPYSFK
jgi:hypothetical protein